MIKKQNKNIIYGIIIILVVALVSWGMSQQNNADTNQIIMFKCGDPIADNFCVQLYPEKSKYTGTSINMKLTRGTSASPREMICPVDGGTGSMFSSCAETLKADGCKILETDIENNKFISVMQCP